MTKRIPMRELAPIRDYGPFPSLRSRLWEVFTEWFGERYAYVSRGFPLRPDEPFFDAWNEEGHGSTVRLGCWEIGLNRYLPFVETVRDTPPASAQEQHA